MMCINLTRNDQVKCYTSFQDYQMSATPQANVLSNSTMNKNQISNFYLFAEPADIFSHYYSILSKSEKYHLHTLHGKLHATLGKLKYMKERIMETKKKYYFYKKLLDTLLDDMKSPAIVIIGCPQLALQELYCFFASLSRRLNVRFNDTNIELMAQTKSEYKKDPTIKEQIPILVKLKTLKIKNLYLSAVKKEMKLSESAKKFGFQVNIGKDVLKGIFINEQLTQDKLFLYRFVFSQSKKRGYQCFVNDSKIYIRKSIYHKPIVVKSRHILRVLDQKRYTHELIDNKTLTLSRSSTSSPESDLFNNKKIRFKRRRV